MDTSYLYYDTPGPSNYSHYYQQYDSGSAYCEQSWSSSSSGHSIGAVHEYAGYEPQFHPDPLRAESNESRESFSSASPPPTSAKKPTKKQREQEMELEEKSLESEIKKLRRKQSQYEQYLSWIQTQVDQLLCGQKK